MADDTVDRTEDLPTSEARVSGWDAVRQAIADLEQIDWLGDDIRAGLGNLDQKVQNLQNREGN
jgi:hypothetical protein